MKMKFHALIILLVLIACEGQDGEIGPTGLKSLIKVTNIQDGVECLTGGVKIETGIDLNNNNTLEPGEIDNSVFVCNGQDGLNGTDNYLTYVAVINQTGTNVPVSTIIKNTLDLNITWERLSQGKFKGTLDKDVNLSKTAILNNNVQVVCKFLSANEITLENTCGVNAFCDDFSNLSIEVKLFD